jgi:NADPH:quinone reductase-like Zn-dependent oxidoreductase
MLLLIKCSTELPKLNRLVEEGLDAVFDSIGGKHIKRSFKVLGSGGKLVSYGFYNSVMGKGGSNPLDFLRLKWWNFLPDHRSTSFYSIGALRKKHPDWFSEDLITLFNLLKNKKINPIIDRRIPLAKAKKAYKLIENAKPKGKIILEL